MILKRLGQDTIQPFLWTLFILKLICYTAGLNGDILFLEA